jgi:hypothetical protein
MEYSFKRHTPFNLRDLAVDSLRLCMLSLILIDNTQIVLGRKRLGATLCNATLRQSQQPK